MGVGAVGGADLLRALPALLEPLTGIRHHADREPRLLAAHRHVRARHPQAAPAGTRRAPPSRTLCASPRALQQATERRPGGCLSPPPLPTGLLSAPAVIRASSASSSAAAAAIRRPPAARRRRRRRLRQCALGVRFRQREARARRGLRALPVSSTPAAAMGPRARVALASAVCREFHGRSSVC